MRLFDASILTREQKILLGEFFERRKKFDQFIADNKLKLFTCPSCGYPTLPERNSYHICKICRWEDDGQDDPHASEIWGGPNTIFSLTQIRVHIGEDLKRSGITPEEEKTILSAEMVLQKLSAHKRVWRVKKNRLK